MAVFNCAPFENENSVENENGFDLVVETQTDDIETGELSVEGSLKFKGVNGVNVAISGDTVVLGIDPDVFPEYDAGGGGGTSGGSTGGTTGGGTSGGSSGGGLLYSGTVTTDGTGVESKLGNLGVVLSLTYGEAYKVVLDGIAYKCVYAVSSVGDYPYLGNPNMLNSDNADTGEPFALMFASHDTYLRTKTAGDYSLAIYEASSSGCTCPNIYTANSVEELPDPSTVPEGSIGFVKSSEAITLTSPNGTVYRITVSDDGTLAAEAV